MRRALYPLMLAWLLVGGCSTATLGSRQPSSGDIEELKKRVLELQRQARVTEVELARLREQLARLEARMGEGQMRSMPSPSVPARPVEPPPQLGPPAEEIEEQDIVEPAPPATASSRREESSSPVPQAAAGAETQALTPAAQALYDRGYTLYHQGHYLDAEAGFQRFLQAYADTELADNAQYWIGESRYGRGDLRGALAAFRETVERYPNGNKVPDALLKAGQCLEALGDVEGARLSYREVRRRFPGSPAAVVAAEHQSRLP